MKRLWKNLLFGTLLFGAAPQSMSAAEPSQPKREPTFRDVARGTIRSALQILSEIRQAQELWHSSLIQKTVRFFDKRIIVSLLSEDVDRKRHEILERIAAFIESDETEMRLDQETITNPLFDCVIPQEIKDVVNQELEIEGREPTVSQLDQSHTSPNKFLIVGDPGTGKSKCAEWIAQELEIPCRILNIRGNIGEQISRAHRFSQYIIQEALSGKKKYKRFGFVLLIDEVNVLGKNMSLCDHEEQMIRTNILPLLELIQPHILVIGTSNYHLDHKEFNEQEREVAFWDPAFLQRFNKTFTIPRPNEELRKKLLPALARASINMSVVKCMERLEVPIPTQEDFNRITLIVFNAHYTEEVKGRLEGIAADEHTEGLTIRPLGKMFETARSAGDEPEGNLSLSQIPIISTVEAEKDQHPWRYKALKTVGMHDLSFASKITKMLVVSLFILKFMNHKQALKQKALSLLSFCKKLFMKGPREWLAFLMRQMPFIKEEITFLPLTIKDALFNMTTMKYLFGAGLISELHKRLTWYNRPVIQENFWNRTLFRVPTEETLQAAALDARHSEGLAVEEESWV